MTNAKVEKDTKDLLDRLITYSKCLGGLAEDKERNGGPLKKPLESAMQKVLLELGDTAVHALDVVFAAKLLLRLWAKFFPHAPIPWTPLACCITGDPDLSQLNYVHFEHAETTTGLEAIVHFENLTQAVKLSLSLLPPKEEGKAVVAEDLPVQAAVPAETVALNCPMCKRSFLVPKYPVETLKILWNPQMSTACPHCGHTVVFTPTAL